MRFKIKKRYDKRIIRLEADGEIKEVIINSDILDPKKEKISICFRGRNSSGILELSSEEANNLYDTLSSKLNLIKGFKVIKETKEDKIKKVKK